MKKRKVALFFGGRSAEHGVSLQSAKSVYEALPKDKYEVLLVGIDRQGRWLLQNASKFLLNDENPELIALNSSKKDVAMVLDKPGDALLVETEGGKRLGDIDVVFPILHGPYGEDGTIQGMMKLLNVACVGAGVLGSAIGMDKDVMKRLLKADGICVAKFLTIRDNESITFERVKKELGLPFFVKPANLGSSVGVSKVASKLGWEKALREAFLYDTKVICEENIEGREIECSVLGNADPVASLPGEILLHDEFYSYSAKYIDEHGAELLIPAELPEKVIKETQETAIRVFKVLECSGMARVDFFVTEDEKVVVNEINTIPGFTKISMYPKLWEASGMSYSHLCSQLIELAVERHEKESRLLVSRMAK